MFECIVDPRCEISLYHIAFLTTSASNLAMLPFDPTHRRSQIQSQQIGDRMCLKLNSIGQILIITNLSVHTFIVNSLRILAFSRRSLQICFFGYPMHLELDVCMNMYEQDSDEYDDVLYHAFG